MALNSSIKVAMPEHGAVKRRMGDKVYVHYATAVYNSSSEFCLSCYFYTLLALNV